MIEDKKSQLIDMLSAFCDENLNEEFGHLSVKLVEKMSRKHTVPFKRGKIENWASGIIYAIAQINFLFDKSSEPHTSPDEICDYFNTKKSTASNKARDIRKMFDLGHFDEEFSTNAILANRPVHYMDENGFIIPEKFLINNSDLEMLMDRICEFGGEEIPDDLNMEFITELVNSTLYCAPFFESVAFLENPGGEKYFACFTSRSEFSKTYPEIPNPVPYPFYDFCQAVHESDGNVGFDGVILNHHSQNLTISCEMMMALYEVFD